MPYKDPEKRREAGRKATAKYRESHPDRVREQMTRNNASRVQAQHDWYVKDRSENPDKWRDKDMRRRHGDRWAEILERDGYACVVCGSVDRLHIDHIVPRKLGGTHAMENQQTLCQQCHMRKDAKLRWDLVKASGKSIPGLSYP